MAEAESESPRRKVSLVKYDPTMKVSTTASKISFRIS